MGRRRESSKLKEHSLLVWACERMTPALIDRLAGCDVPWQSVTNVHAITSIVKSCEVPVDLDWEPSEVCSLWSWNPHKHARPDDHIINIWATCVLLISGVHPDCQGRNGVGEGLSEKIASLLWNVIALREVFDEARVFFGWLIEQTAANFRDQSDYEPSSFAWLALLILHAQFESPAQIVEETARGVFEASESENECKYLFRNDNRRWKSRLVLQLSNFDQHHHLWEKMARDAHKLLAARTDAPQMPMAIDVLARVAGMKK